MQGGGLVAGGGGGFDSNYVGRGAPGGGMINPNSGPNGGFGTRSGDASVAWNPSIHGGQGGGGTGGGGSDYYDISKGGGGLAGLSNQAAGTPKAPNPTAANPQGLNTLVQQSKKKPTRTLAQTYRPNSYGINT
jgi:hypothetical protein